MGILQAQNVHYIYQSKYQKVHAVKGINFDFEEGKSYAIVGKSGCGKTTFLNALSAYIPADERIVTIEDSAELQIRQIPNLVRMETRNDNGEGNRPISVGDLIRASLRMRPDGRKIKK